MSHAFDTVSAAITEHGAPTRARTGVVHDADGYSVAVLWTFTDDTVLRQVFDPAQATEADARILAQHVANIIRDAFGAGVVTELPAEMGDSNG